MVRKSEGFIMPEHFFEISKERHCRSIPNTRVSRIRKRERIVSIFSEPFLSVCTFHFIILLEVLIIIKRETSEIITFRIAKIVNLNTCSRILGGALYRACLLMMYSYQLRAKHVYFGTGKYEMVHTLNHDVEDQYGVNNAASSDRYK